MKRLIALMLASTLVCCHEQKKQSGPVVPEPPKAPASAGQESPNQKESFAKAKESVTNDGYIGFAYAADWDRYSESFAKAWIGSPEIQKAAGTARLILTPIYQDNSEATKKKANEFWGPIQEKQRNFGRASYPAIMFFDKNGRHYADIFGPDMLTRSIESIATEVAEKLALLHKQDDLMEQGRKAKGAAALGMLSEAATMKGITRPDGVVDALKKADGNSNSAYLRRVTFDGVSNASAKRDAMGKLKTKEEKWNAIQDLIKETETNLADDAYTDEQKQEMCACLIGVLHRDGGYKGSLLIPAWGKRMTELGPDTYLGKSGKVVGDVWGFKLNYSEGWTPKGIPDDNTPIELKGDLPIKEAGSYAVRFSYERGNHALFIKKVILKDGDTVVAEDEHRGEASKSPKENSYTLAVDSAIKNPRLFIIMDNGDKRDSYGIIRIDHE